MMHREVFEFALQLTQQAPQLMASSRGIRPAPLQHYLRATMRRNSLWVDRLRSVASAGTTTDSFSVADAERLRRLFEEMATSSVLVRVASTLLFTAGQRLDIPLASDVAERTARGHFEARQSAIAWTAEWADLAPLDWDALGRLGRICDTLSDLLCGAMQPIMRSSRFVVDRDRAADFAETFGQRLAMLVIPVRAALSQVPNESMLHARLATEIAESLEQCLPTRATGAAVGTLASITHQEAEPPTAPSILPMPFALKPNPAAESSDRAVPLSFPTLAFSQLRRARSDGA